MTYSEPTQKRGLHPTAQGIVRLLSLFLLMTYGATAFGASLSLAGQWQFQLDPKDEGVTNQWWTGSLNDQISLPGTTAIAHKGNPLKLEPKLDKTTLQHLHQKYSYIGPAWYQREIELPADWQGQDVRLTLERVIWETRVWINGKPAGMQDSLATPHRYEIGGDLHPGKNSITIRVDNRKKLDIGIGHAYTEETQTIWNGIVGRIELEPRPLVRIEHLKTMPSLEEGSLKVTVTTINKSASPVSAELALQAEPDNFRGATPDPLRMKVTLTPGTVTQTVAYPMGAKFERWSEFNPKVYSLKASLSASGKSSALRQTFGMREIKTRGRQILVNRQPVFLRGTLECCIFPETAHPAMDDRKWEKIFRTMKAHGLNHVRFHSWCPPEAAFRVADREGIYIQVELPNWSFKMGELPEVDAFFRAEGERMIREYSHHPSWVMFSMGNELLGDFNQVDALVARLRSLAPGLLFTSTSYSFARGGAPRGLLPGPQDDYFISMETKSGWVRGQGFLNQTKPNTESDYSEGLACLSIPLVSHEVGQYNVFPNLAELPKYKPGPLRALGFEAIRNDLESKGRLNEAKRYTRDSGKLAALLYKEDIERALRTKDQAGIALLDLHDFPGQSTATVGLLDAFWDSKGLISPEEFRRFCGPTVPLVRMAKFVFENNESFEAGVEIAHFGRAPLTNATVYWKLEQGPKVIGKGSLDARTIPLGNGIQLGRIRQPLSGVATAAELKLSVGIAGTDIVNDWRIWVYPSADSSASDANLLITESIDEALIQALRDGQRVLLLPARAALKAPIDGRFIPVFWSPLHFPNQPGTLGATIDPKHPVWNAFPTRTHTDWQWWELLSKSYAVNLDSVVPRPAMPFRFVDKFDRNALPAGIFEVKVGPGRLLVCTLDISSDTEKRIAARQLRRSILSYMQSADFKPSVAWSEGVLMSLASDARYSFAASSSSGSYQPELAVDGDDKTFWHTDWDHGVAMPAQFDIDLRHEVLLEGFTYTPRQDMKNGRIGQYSVQVSVDGKTWKEWVKENRFPDTTEKQTVKFEQPIKARFLRLTAHTDLGNSGNAAIAEIVPLFKETQMDVRDLGIVPGFNDGN